MIRQKGAVHEYLSPLNSDYGSLSSTNYVSKIAVGSGIVIAPNNQNYRKRKKRFHLSNIDDDKRFQSDLVVYENMYSTKL